MEVSGWRILVKSSFPNTLFHCTREIFICCCYFYFRSKLSYGRLEKVHTLGWMAASEQRATLKICYLCLDTGRAEICMYNTVGLFQFQVCHRVMHPLWSILLCVSWFRDVQTIVKLLVKFNNFMFYFTSTLHYKLCKFYLFFVVCRQQNCPEVYNEMGIDIFLWSYILLVLFFIYYSFFVFC